MLERAIEVKELPAWQDLDEWKTDEWLVKPESVCRWFREKGLTLPEPLHRLADGLFPLINKRAAAARKERELNQQQKECVEFAFKCAQEWPEMARSPRGGKITASSLTTLLEQKAPLKWKDTSEPPYCHDRLTRLISKHVIPEIRKDKRSVRTKNVQRPEK